MLHLYSLLQILPIVSKLELVERLIQMLNHMKKTWFKWFFSFVTSCYVTSVCNLVGWPYERCSNYLLYHMKRYILTRALLLLLLLLLFSWLLFEWIKYASLSADVCCLRDLSHYKQEPGQQLKLLIFSPFSRGYSRWMQIEPFCHFLCACSLQVVLLYQKMVRLWSPVQSLWYSSAQWYVSLCPKLHHECRNTIEYTRLYWILCLLTGTWYSDEASITGNALTAPDITRHSMRPLPPA